LELAQQLLVSLSASAQSAAAERGLDLATIVAVLDRATVLPMDWRLDNTLRPLRLAVSVRATSLVGFGSVTFVGRVFGAAVRGVRVTAFAIEDLASGLATSPNWGPLGDVSLGRPTAGSAQFNPEQDWLGGLVDSIQRAAATPLIRAAEAFTQHDVEWHERQEELSRRTYAIESQGWICMSCKRLQPSGRSDCTACHRPVKAYGARIRLSRPMPLEEGVDVVLFPVNAPESQGSAIKGKPAGLGWLVALDEYGQLTDGSIKLRLNTAVPRAQLRSFSGLNAGDLGLAGLAKLLATPEAFQAPTIDTEEAGELDLRRELNRSQKTAVLGAINLEPGEVLLVQGPPGTGKTTSIVETVRLLLALEPELHIVVTSHSNTAVDSAQERLADLGLDIVRVADATKVDKKFHDSLVSADDPRLDRAQVILGTVNRLALCQWPTGMFDWLILDEANKVRISEMLPILSFAQRWVLVGDHRQLPPVVDEGAADFPVGSDESRASVRDASFFELWWNRLPNNRQMLEEQYRMSPAIGSYVSTAFYDGRLKNGPDTSEFRSPLRWPFNRNLAWLTIAGSEKKGASGSVSNTAEIKAVGRVVRRLKELGAAKLKAAVIAMYQDQVKALQHELEPMKLPWLAINTVDAFEGKEADVVILSLVRSNEAQRIGFLKKAQRLNVAVSRAQRLLIVVGNIDTITGHEGQDLYQPLLDQTRREGRVAGVGALHAMERGHRLRSHGGPSARHRRRRPGPKP
jgi:hypothetical protein